MFKVIVLFRNNEILSKNYSFSNCKGRHQLYNLIMDIQIMFVDELHNIY